MRRLIVAAVAVLLSFGATSASAAAPVDKRAPVTVKASPRERAALLGFMRGQELKDAEAQDQAMQIRMALDLRDVGRQVADLQAKGKLTDEAFSEVQKPFRLARDVLDNLVKLLGRPMSGGQSEVLTPWRQELDEVLAGRNPYDDAKK